jgi:hypothetical protein
MASRSTRGASARDEVRPNTKRYEDLSRQNRESHQEVERSLREAERIAKARRERPSTASA